MKRLLPLLLFVLYAASAPAAEVSAKDAARAASAWVDRGYAMGRLPAGRTVAGVDEVEDPATGAQLRVVRFEGGGFVVLSADDLVDPVLAFSETGDGLDLDDNNPFWALLRGDIAAREAAAGVERGGGAKRGATKAASEPTAAQSRWADLLSDAGGGTLRKSAQGVSAISDVRVPPLSSRNGVSRTPTTPGARRTATTTIRPATTSAAARPPRSPRSCATGGTRPGRSPNTPIRAGRTERAAPTR
jgi:hypothetical protein